MFNLIKLREQTLGLVPFLFHFLFYFFFDIYFSFLSFSFPFIPTIFNPSFCLGTNKTITPLHYDSYNNIFVQVQGFKYIRIYSPDQTGNLYVIESSANPVNGGGGGGEGAGEGAEGLSRTTAQGNMSRVKCEKEDKEKYPLCVKADYYEVGCLF